MKPQTFNTLERKGILDISPGLLNSTTVFSPIVGPIVLRYSVPRMVQYIVVPHRAFRVVTEATSAHHEISSKQVLTFQPQLSRSKNLLDNFPSSHPIAVLLPGHESPLIDLSSAPELLSQLDVKFIPPSTVSRPTTIIFYVLQKQSEPTADPPKQPDASDADPEPTFYDVQIRGLGIDRVEESASSIGACTLAAYLALRLSDEEYGDDLTPTVTSNSTDDITKNDPEEADPVSEAPTTGPPQQQTKTLPIRTSASSMDDATPATTTTTQQSLSEKPSSLHYVFNFTQSVHASFSAQPRTSQMCVEVYLSAAVKGTVASSSSSTDKDKDTDSEDSKGTYEIKEIGLSGRSTFYLRGELSLVY